MLCHTFYCIVNSIVLALFQAIIQKQEMTLDKITREHCPVMIIRLLFCFFFPRDEHWSCFCGSGAKYTAAIQNQCYVLWWHLWHEQRFFRCTFSLVKWRLNLWFYLDIVLNFLFVLFFQTIRLFQAWWLDW